jgi:uncharacterized membrane protein (DUF2068 family)
VARAPTLDAIVGYKLTKGPIQLVLAALLLLFGARVTQSFATFLGRHASAGWSAELAHRLGSLGTVRELHITSLALGADGVLTLVEGILLLRGYWWAPWFVVLTTALLLPFEAVALVERHSVGHVLLLVLNLAVFAYLIRMARAHHALGGVR